MLDRNESGTDAPWTTVALMAAMTLTRTAALPMVGAYALWALSRRGRPFTARLRGMAPALAALAAYGLWVVLRPSMTEDDYARILVERGQGLFDGRAGFLAALGMSMARQAHAIVEGWAGSLLLFWVEGQPCALRAREPGRLLSLAGLALRFVRGKPDAWMLAAYLATLLAWPFYEQMERFLFPALPVLVLYAFLRCGRSDARDVAPARPRRMPW